VARVNLATGKRNPLRITQVKFGKKNTKHRGILWSPGAGSTTRSLDSGKLTKKFSSFSYSPSCISLFPSSFIPFFPHPLLFFSPPNIY
jgi:hypothetical protein